MTQPYTDADVDLVARELRTTVEGGETITDAAGRILSALASAGRLAASAALSTPPDTASRTEPTDTEETA